MSHQKPQRTFEEKVDSILKYRSLTLFYRVSVFVGCLAGPFVAKTLLRSEIALQVENQIGPIRRDVSAIRSQIATDFVDVKRYERERAELLSELAHRNNITSQQLSTLSVQLTTINERLSRIEGALTYRNPRSITP